MDFRVDCDMTSRRTAVKVSLLETEPVLGAVTSGSFRAWSEVIERSYRNNEFRNKERNKEHGTPKPREAPWQ